MKKILLLLTILAQPSFATDYKEDIETFFELLKSQQNEKAVTSLFQSNKWVGPNSDMIIQTQKQIDVLQTEVVGELRKTVLIGEHKFKGVFLNIAYLAIYDRQPITFEFQYYKPQKEWVIHSMQFSDDFDDIYEEAAKMTDIKNNL